MLKKIFFKKYKLNKLQKIKQISQYIYFFRYNDVNMKEIILLKKTIKKFNYQSIILNQNLTFQIFPKLNGPGAILLIYGNNDLDLLKNLKNFTKFKFISLVFQNQIYSYYKLTKILHQNYLPLNNLLIQPFLNFVYYLRKI